jgi:outer membrane protein OmpA-like peptidoglycan-associated protein
MKTLLVLALASLAATAAAAGELSKSVMRPTPVTAGVVAGSLPGSGGSASYYIALDLKAGALMTQLAVEGRANTDRKLAVELLNADARVAASASVMAGLDARAEATRSFRIDSAGRYVARITAGGPETGTWCVLMGGTALPGAADAACPARAAVVAPVLEPRAEPALRTEPRVEPAPAPARVAAPARPPAFEVIVSGCEERLRVGADFLFDFDRAELRADAEPTLEEIAARLASQHNPVLIEGHTDGKGSDAYNQALSERRAGAVRASLTARGLPVERLAVRGYGKMHPVADNVRSDGSDDPVGRQKNRRVEVVVNTCN